MNSPNAHNDLLRAFGLAVRTRRDEIGLTQAELAHRADLHRSYIGDIERGARNVALLNVWRLASALNVTLAELMDRTMRHLPESK